MNLASDTRKPAMEGVNLESIGTLVELIGESEVVEKKLLERRFQERAQGFEVTLGFMNALRALTFGNGHSRCTRGFNDMHDALRKGKYAFAQYIATRSAESKTDFGNEILAVIGKFILKNGQAQVASEGLGGIHYAARNFLLETGVLHFDYRSSTYRIEDWFYRTFIKTRYTRGPAPEQLNEMLRDQAAIGHAAELAVCKYERNIVGYRDAKSVVHVALKNVEAGFDIASVRRKEKSDQLYLRLIEVKAVGLKDWSFTLTENEVRVARENEDSYFLYLVPVVNGKPNIERMNVVRNPVKNLLDKSLWKVERGDWNVCRVNHDD